MVNQVNIAEAKAKLSELVTAASEGEDVVIARSGRPMVRLVPVTEPEKRRLGFLAINLDDAFFDALDDDTLTAWE